MGHQRAIALGLAYIQQHVACDAVAVMDADGEDTPEGLVDLLRRYREHGGGTAVFAARARRSESIAFRLFYRVFKALHWCLTGIGVRIGNFSVLPRAHLDTLVVSSDMWNHYAATVFRSKLPFVECPVARGGRIAGTSSMSFVALVSHGLGAISVFSDIVGVRALIASLSAALMAAVGIAAVLIIRLFTPFALPGWAAYFIGALAILTIQFISIAASFTFFTLSNRASLGFVPVRDYALFVADVIVDADVHV